MRRRVLIFHAGALGDFVLTWPMALAVSRMLPQHRTAYVTTTDKGALAGRVLRVEAVDVEGGWHTLHSQGELDPRCRKMLENTHAAYGIGMDAAWADRVRALGVPDVQTLVPPVRWGGHSRAVDSPAEQLPTALAAGVRSAIHLVETRGLLPSRTPGKDIVLHVGSGSATKNWPHFEALGDDLRDRGLTVDLVAGEAEAGHLPRGRLSSIKVLKTLAELQTRLESAAVMVGNDSGPGHLAAMLGVPTVSLFGPASDASRWAPIGPKVKVLHGDSLEHLGASTVAGAVAEMVGG